MQQTQTWAAEKLTQIEEKMIQVVQRNQGIIPYTTDDQGHFKDMFKEVPTWWTNGFWGALLWQMYTLTQDDLYRQEAVATEEKLDGNLMNAEGLDHDNGFKWELTAVENYRLTGAKDSRNRGLLAANNLAGRFNLNGRFIRAWNDWGDLNRSGLAIVDCLMNLPLLYWASEETQDPRFKQIAVAHAKTAQEYLVRPDGSVKHIIVFDPETGAYLRSEGGQGYGHGSSWTRGQGWGIYGFTLSYEYTKDESFLNTAKQIANYFIANIPSNGLIPIDFRQPSEPWLEDSSAAAIAASGLLELAKYTTGRDQEIFQAAAVKLLKALADHSCDWQLDHDHLLTSCSASYDEENHEYPIIYGDYFFIEALAKLAGHEFKIW